MNTRLLVLAAAATLGFGSSARAAAQLNVRLNDGALELTNSASTVLQLAGYSILSPSGSLENTNWISIATSYDGNDGGEVDPDDNWFFLANNDNEFAEATLGSATIRPGQIVDLGVGAFVPGGSTDLVFEFVDAATQTSQIGVVVYGTLIDLMADFNSDSTVDGDDFLIWQSNFGVTDSADRTIGDANGDGAVDGNDFLIWQSEFGESIAASGGGSVTAVPEPATASLAVLLWTAALLGGFRRER